MLFRWERSQEQLRPLGLDWVQFSADVARSLADWQSYKKEAQSYSINHSYNFELSNTSYEDNAMVHEKHTRVLGFDARPFPKSHKEKSPLTHSQKKRSNIKVAWIAGKKTENTWIKCTSMHIQRENCKVGMLRWKQDSVTMQNTVNHVTWMHRYFREGWQVSKAQNIVMAVNQHTEYHLAVKIVIEREQEQRIAGVIPRRKNNKHTHELRRLLNGMACGRVRGGIRRGSGLKFSLHDGFSAEFKWLRLIHDKRTSERGVRTPTRHKPRVSSCTSSFCHGAIVIVQVFKSRLCHLLSASGVRSLLGASRTDSLWCCCIAVALRVATTVSRRGTSLCVHSTLHTVHCERFPWFGGYRHTPFSKGMRQSTIQLLAEMYWQETSSHAGTTRRTHHKKFDEQFFSCLSAVRSNWFCDTKEISNFVVRQVESASGGELHADALYVLEDMRILSWDWNFRSKASETTCLQKGHAVNLKRL